MQFEEEIIKIKELELKWMKCCDLWNSFGINLNKSDNIKLNNEEFKRNKKYKSKVINHDNLSDIAYIENRTPLIVTLPSTISPLDYSSIEDYALKIRNERGVAEPTEVIQQIEKSKQGDRQKSTLELLAEKRDYKRRRQTYRAKNTHLTKRTPTQVARDIIFLRLEELYNTKAIKLHKDDPFFIKKEEQEK